MATLVIEINHCNSCPFFNKPICSVIDLVVDVLKVDGLSPIPSWCPKELHNVYEQLLYDDDLIITEKDINTLTDILNAYEK